ncbi:restriction endonuclease subunit S [Francisella tularensis]|uniref:restriction endonuclease subunit S n=1 Tax=Francisella tularensis TaxID=263 RepID=UPI001C0F2660|nr:restriction endonuclease subunit S [Francisella tularensis]MBK2110558.1 restriction endonuclease subunit S [Francisella tularensis subsp. novicida FSC595]
MKSKKLSDIANISIGVPIARYKSKPNNQEGQKIEYKLFSQNMLSDTGIFQEYQADTFIANKDLSFSCTQEDDIVFGLRKPNQAVHIDSNNTNLLVQSYMAIIRCNSDIILPEYLAFKLNTQDIYNQLHKNIQGGSAIQLLKIQSLKDIVIQIPSLESQKQLISVLKTGYSEIQVLEQIIQHKQQLLKSII